MCVTIVVTVLKCLDNMQRGRIFLFLIILVGFPLMYIMYGLFGIKTKFEHYINMTLAVNQDNCRSENRIVTFNQSDSREKRKIILHYTTWFKDIPVVTVKCCPGFQCHVTTDKSKLLESDAVVFHGRDLPKPDEMPQRTTNQRWVFYLMENPFNSGIKPFLYNGLFNWTMTYEYTSDLVLPYGAYKKLEKPHEDIKQNHATKDKFAVYVNSHCRTPVSFRERYIRKLNKFIKLDVYGQCGGIFGRIICPRNSDKCQKRLKRYKFYISFENARCEDYITEKYWSVPLRLGAIPVVYNYNNMFERLAIPGSYIDASKFKDAKSLSEYLKYLDSNDTAYNEYFQWKQFYERVDLEPWPCRLCQMLHNNSLPPKTYDNFDQVLNPEHKCDMSVPVI